MDMIQILREAMKKQCSDIFLVPGSSISVKINGVIQPLNNNHIMPADSMELIKQIYDMDQQRSIDAVLESGDDDFSLSIQGVGRFRCNVYKQRNSMAAVLRVVSFDMPNAEKLHIPQRVIDLHQEKNGMVLVTGPAGSGKSTTLACIIDRINEMSASHIITVEDPIEFIHKHKKSIVSQREVEHDTKNYITALRAALRQSPNVVLVGEMRDLETIQIALTAAETGQLVFSSLHTIGSAKTIDRIIDVFPASQQQQIRLQLALVLRAVVSQQLIPTIDGGLEPVFEIMFVNTAIQNLIRDNKVHQIDNVIHSGVQEGMQTMDHDIMRLYQTGKITKENAILYASKPDILRKKL